MLIGVFGLFLITLVCIIFFSNIERDNDRQWYFELKFDEKHDYKLPLN